MSDLENNYKRENRHLNTQNWILESAIQKFSTEVHVILSFEGFESPFFLMEEILRVYKILNVVTKKMNKYTEVHKKVLKLYKQILARHEQIEEPTTFINQDFIQEFTDMVKELHDCSQRTFEHIAEEFISEIKGLINDYSLKGANKKELVRAEEVYKAGESYRADIVTPNFKNKELKDQFLDALKAIKIFIEQQRSPTQFDREECDHEPWISEEYIFCGDCGKVIPKELRM